MQYFRLSYYFNRFTHRYRDMKPIGILLLGDLGNWLHNLPTNIIVFFFGTLFACFIGIVFSLSESFSQTQLGVNFIYLGLVMVLCQLIWEGFFDVDLIKKFYRQLAFSGYNRRQLLKASVINECLSYKLIAFFILITMFLWTNYTHYGVLYASVWAMGWFVVVHVVFNTLIGLLKMAIYFSPLRTTHYIIRVEMLLLIIGAGIFAISLFSDILDKAFVWLSTIL